MKIENCKLKISNKAFTLIEIMVAIAIVSILSAVVLVSMKSYGAKARSSKAQAQLSSAIPGMVSCWGNGGQVRKPSSNGGNEICYINGALSTQYGYWPSSDYTYDSDQSITGATCGGMGLKCIDKTQWWVKVKSVSDDSVGCCNMTVGGCASTIKSVSSDNCSKTAWTD